MTIEKLSAVYFSATNVTKKYVTAMADEIGVPCNVFDFTLPKDRDLSQAPAFDHTDTVIVGFPVYSGRVPDICREYLLAVKGNGAKCIVVATYGNRAYEDALAEARDILTANGFCVIAGAALVGRHSYSDKIAGNRPTPVDLNGAKKFIRELISKDDSKLSSIDFPGARPYRAKGAAKALAPVTTDACIDCKLCAEQCPSGIISFTCPKELVKPASECLRCNRCITICPVNAKIFTDPEYLISVERCITMFGSPDKENVYFMAD